MGYSAALIARIVTAAVIAILFGNGSVVAFNRIKPQWFEDWDEESIKRGSETEPRKILPIKLVEADADGRQRLPSRRRQSCVSSFAATQPVTRASTR